MARWTFAILFGFLMLAGFQNCAKIDVTAPQANLSSLGTPTPSPTATATPQPTPGLVLKKTFFYFGASGNIPGLVIDHNGGTVSSLGSVSYMGNQAGWLSYDSLNRKILAPDANGNQIQIFGVDLSTGLLTSAGIFNFFQQVVHLAVVKTAAGFNLFGSNYNGGSLGFYSGNANLSAVNSVQSVSPGPMTHSSSYDSQRNLLYVASLGGNAVLVYRVDAATLTPVGQISVASPRTVVYDFMYDKLYVSTEVNGAGNSYLRGFSVSYVNNVFTSADVGSVAMPLSGGDLKINHKLNVVFATARQVGQESVWGMPVLNTGVQDPSRQPFTFAVTQPLPRSLEITEDGQYAVVASGGGATTDSILIYRLAFDSAARFQSATKIYSQQQNAVGLLCAASIPTY